MGAMNYPWLVHCTGLRNLPLKQAAPNEVMKTRFLSLPSGAFNPAYADGVQAPPACGKIILVAHGSALEAKTNRHLSG